MHQEGCSVLSKFDLKFYLECSRGSAWSCCIVAITGKFLFLLSWFENLKWAHESVVHTHHCSSIVKFTTVVWSREYGDKLTLCKKFVTILHYLHQQCNYQLQVGEQTPSLLETGTTYDTNHLAILGQTRFELCFFHLKTGDWGAEPASLSHMFCRQETT